MDAKDILGLPKTPLSITQEKKSRPQKDSQRKPDGISREVYPPLALSFLVFRAWMLWNFIGFIEWAVKL